MVHQVETRTFVTTDILIHEYEYMFGDRKDMKVDFTFINNKTGKENTKTNVFTCKKSPRPCETQKKRWQIQELRVLNWMIK